MKSFASIAALLVSFSIGFALKDSTGHASSVQAKAKDPPKPGEYTLSQFVQKDTPLDAWLAHVDVLHSASLPWDEVLTEVHADSELQKLVVYHWAKRDAKACWEHLKTWRDSPFFNELAMIAIMQADPQEAITWPNPKEESFLRWALFAKAQRIDLELAFSLVSEVGPMHDSRDRMFDDWDAITLTPDWAEADPQRACDLLDTSPPHILRSFAGSAARALAKEDLAGAISWAKAQNMGIEGQAMGAIARLLFEKDDLEGVERIALNTRSVQAREQIIKPVLDRLDRESPSSAEQWIRDHLQGTLQWKRLVRRDISLSEEPSE